jgi:hypothetical protein
MQQTVTIRAESDRGMGPRQLTLRSGESALFGTCACDTCPLDLVVGAGSPWLAGKVTAAKSHWLLCNLARQRSLLVENLENPFEYVTVAPRRRHAPVPFELARIGASDGQSGPMLTVFGPEPVMAGHIPRPCPAVPPFRPPLDRDAAYFAVLEALCQPRLRGSPTEPLPTSEEIVAGLRARQIRLTRRAVDAHIEYVGEKLGLGRGVRRDILVAIAIRRGLIGTV